MTSHVETIWSGGQRHDDSRRRTTESPFQFFDRAAGNLATAVRKLVDEWISNYPEPHRPDVVGRLRSTEVQFEGAFWELYLHEMLRRFASRIEVHPPTPTTSRRPDFLVEAGPSRFYVEARIIDRKPAALGEAARVEAVYDLLRDFLIEQPFSLCVGHLAVGAKAMPTRPLRDFIIRWLEALDYPSTFARYKESGIGAMPTRTWRHEDWELELLVIPLGREDPGPHPALGSWGPARGSMVENDVAVLEALTSKVGAYGVLEAPLVIALLCNTDIPTDPHHIERALYGLHLPHPPDDIPAAGSLQADGDGFWLDSTGWRNDPVPQVVTASNLGLVGIATLGVSPVAWPHPDPDIKPPLHHPAFASAALGPLSIHEPDVPADAFLDIPRELT